MLDFGYYNFDCMKEMKHFPDKYFDLAIVDPPYGNANHVGWLKKKNGRFGGCFDKYKMPEGKVCNIHFNGRNRSNKYKHEDKKINNWDVAPSQEYFEELFRVSKNQIIWGGNYFDLPPTRCFIIWRKNNVPENFSMAMCEYAWTSFDANAKIFNFTAQGGDRFHPTQKPIQLYYWLLNNYAKPGDKILDTHVGSANSLRACEKLGYKYIGFEIDKYYYTRGKELLDSDKLQITMFQ